MSTFDDLPKVTHGHDGEPHADERVAISYASRPEFSLCCMAHVTREELAKKQAHGFTLLGVDGLGEMDWDRAEPEESEFCEFVDAVLHPKKEAA